MLTDTPDRVEPSSIDDITWRERHDLPWTVTVAGKPGPLFADRLRYVIERFQRRTSLSEGHEYVVGVIPAELLSEDEGDDRAPWLCLDALDWRGFDAMGPDLLGEPMDDDVIAVNLGTAPAGTLERLPEFDGW